jgi:hypothetical protein
MGFQLYLFQRFSTTPVHTEIVDISVNKNKSECFLN